MSKTSKPCPGCGATKRSRRADDVCDDCKHAIAKWAEHVAKLNSDPTLATIKLKRQPHWYPMFYFGGPRCQIDGLSETRGILGDLFWELGELACVEKFDWEDAPRRAEGEPEFPNLFSKPDVRFPKKPNEHYAQHADYPASDGSACYHSLYGKIDPKLLGVIQSLWDHAARFAEMAYLGGLQDGRNLLFQLSSGQVSAEDFQKEDLRLARDRQNSRYLHQKLKRKGKHPR